MAKRTTQTNRIFDGMENPIDNIVDLGLVNYVAHPENKRFIVFRFADTNRADSFEEMLKDADIWFERGQEDKRGQQYTLFGINNRDFKRAEKFNYIVEAKHKNRFIPLGWLRWTVIALSAGIMTLTLIGYCKAQKTLDEANRTTEQSIHEKSVEEIIQIVIS